MWLFTHSEGSRDRQILFMRVIAGLKTPLLMDSLLITGGKRRWGIGAREAASRAVP